MEKYCITQVNKKNPIHNVILISKNTSVYRKRVWEEMPKASPLVAETWAGVKTSDCLFVTSWAEEVT